MHLADQNTKALGTETRCGHTTLEAARVRILLRLCPISKPVFWMSGFFSERKS